MPLNEHMAQAPKHGIIVRSKETLEPGLSIFKLGHRFDGKMRQSDEQVISKPWWFTEATVESIDHAAQNANESLAEVFRRFGAVAKIWGGSGDLIVKARIPAPVIAYIGPGTIQDFREKECEESNNIWRGKAASMAFFQLRGTVLQLGRGLERPFLPKPGTLALTVQAAKQM